MSEPDWQNAVLREIGAAGTGLSTGVRAAPPILPADSWAQPAPVAQPAPPRLPDDPWSQPSGSHTRPGPPLPAPQALPSVPLVPDDPWSQGDQQSSGSQGRPPLVPQVADDPWSQSSGSHAQPGPPLPAPQPLPSVPLVP